MSKHSMPSTLDLSSPMREEHDIESTVANKANGESTRDSPEALARSDTRWINCLRLLLIGTLLVVAVGISMATYEVMTKLEYKSFKSEFGRSSARIKQLFLQDLSMKLWFAHISVYSLQESSSGLMDVNMNFLQDLNIAEAITYWDRVAWSPILRTEKERNKWEVYAQTIVTDNHGESNVCHICGEGMEVSSPSSTVTVPGEGVFACSSIEKAGLMGLIPPVSCSVIAPMLGPCNCRKVVANSTNITNNATEHHIASKIFAIKDGKRVTQQRGPYSPIWQGTPSASDDALLYDQMSDNFRRHALMSMMETNLPTFSHSRYGGGNYETSLKESTDTPRTTVFFPVFGNSSNNNTAIGSMAIDFSWRSIFGVGEKLPFNSDGIVLVIESNRGQVFTFQILENRTATLVNVGDMHDTTFDSMKNETTFEDLHDAILRASPKAHAGGNQSALLYKLSVYPSQSFKAQFVTNKPAIYTTVVASIFVFTSAIFILYDIFVRRRQTKVMASAIQANAIVTSLFPDFIKSRLMSRAARPGKGRTFHQIAAPKQQLRNMLNRRSSEIQKAADSSTGPIADFFPSTTVIFADIAGFTAWSSEREPTQVFQLLETVYRSFDAIAERLGVFKIETIGDCYVAVTGLPEPQDDHAVRMARFAHEIMHSMHELVGSMESTLGPGTGNLTIRVGLHSGPVTGGVLRGDKARFQLFGDTMNTAARMQTTGDISMIQTTDSTAALLKEAGFGHWLQQRDKKVSVKGKGEMQTFWIDLAKQNKMGVASDDGCRHPTLDCLSTLSLVEIRNSAAHIRPDELAEAAAGRRRKSDEAKVNRLVSFNSDMLEKFLKIVVASRTIAFKRERRDAPRPISTIGSGNPIEEVTEIITMSQFCEKTVEEQVAPEEVELSEDVRTQLRQYVESVSRMYRDNPFHNFEHASHVVMSAGKIVKRIVKPEDVDYQQHALKKKDRRKAVAQQIHQSTFGISSDALMQFAVIFSAVIHDMDHSGVPNLRLSSEEDEVAIKYNHKSVAEQHSVRLAWDLLMEDRFENLRKAIFTTPEERTRFRQFVVNAVIATDIADAELQLLSKDRWNKAFYCSGNVHDDTDDHVSRKATVVFEYIIQASDVAHTMQHWHVYCKWNERLFHERYRAYVQGREDEDPSDKWYNCEISFFDNYVVPLARKLETCGVFGVSSEEYLNYAVDNRSEWERKGRDIVQGWTERYCAQNLVDNGQTCVLPNGSLKN